MAALIVSCIASARSAKINASAGPPPIPPDTITPTASATPEPTNSASPAGLADPLPEGNYLDGPDGAPHYVLTVSKTATGFGGWLYFVYQDGRTAPMFHYNARARGDRTFTLQTDSSGQPFNVGTPANEGQAGSSPVPQRQTYQGTYVGNSVTLLDCGSYLYWATTHGYGPPQSCAFTYPGSNPSSPSPLPPVPSFNPTPPLSQATPVGPWTPKGEMNCRPMSDGADECVVP